MLAVIDHAKSIHLPTETELLALIDMPWQERFRQLMLWGKALPKLPDSLQVDEALVKGCDSKAWLHHSIEDERHWFALDADTKIIKGVAVVLLTLVQGKSSHDISNINFVDYFTKLGLEQHLSPSRANGINAIAKNIKGYINE